MRSMPQVELFISDPEVLERFRAQLDREVRRVREALAAAELSAPLCGLAFLWVDEDDAAFSYAYAWTADARRETLAQGEGAVDAVWQPADWNIELDDEAPTPAAAQEAEALADLVRASGLSEAAGRSCAISASGSTPTTGPTWPT